jgi:ubiquinol-cytochrome c reductase cytochrome b subunit
VALILFSAGRLLLPYSLGHPDNYIEANPLVTPAHIVPEWYFWPSTRSCAPSPVDFILPAKLWGVLAMFASILLLFFLTWLDRSPIRSTSYRPVYSIFFWVLVADIILLGLCGVMPAEQPWIALRRSRRLLFLALPDHPAAGLQVREAAAAPQQHLAKRASW